MKKSILLVLLLSLITLAVAEQYEHEREKHYGPCGKFSTERMLTHKLRHCKKAAIDLYAPVSRQCCKDLQNVSIPCLLAIFNSHAFKNLGVKPHTAITVPARCHHTYDRPPTTSTIDPH